VRLIACTVNLSSVAGGQNCDFFVRFKFLAQALQGLLQPFGGKGEPFPQINGCGSVIEA
jgi:hypothetical protein